MGALVDLGTDRASSSSTEGPSDRSECICNEEGALYGEFSLRGMQCNRIRWRTCSSGIIPGDAVDLGFVRRRKVGEGADEFVARGTDRNSPVMEASSGEPVRKWGAGDLLKRTSCQPAAHSKPLPVDVLGLGVFGIRGNVQVPLQGAVLIGLCQSKQEPTEG